MITVCMWAINGLTTDAPLLGSVWKVYRNHPSKGTQARWQSLLTFTCHRQLLFLATCNLIFLSVSFFPLSVFGFWLFDALKGIICNNCTSSFSTWLQHLLIFSFLILLTLIWFLFCFIYLPMSFYFPCKWTPFGHWSAQTKQLVFLIGSST